MINLQNIEYFENHNLDSKTEALKYQRANLFFSSTTPLKIKRGNKVLDVGCGVGIYGETMKEKYNVVVEGIDQSSGAVEIARRRGIKAKVADIDKKWPFKNSSFDVVMGVQVLEHVFNTDNFFLEAKRVLKKKGLLIISTPNLAVWFNRLIFIFGYQPFFTEVSTKDKTIGMSFTRRLTANREVVGHLRVFTLKALKDMTEQYNFKIENTVGGSVDYLPRFMKPFDEVFSHFPSLASDLIIIARKT